MSKESTFPKGGIHPSDMKYLSKDSSIERICPNGELIVPMSQHLGAPATLLKNIGDKVEKGEKIGSASSFISANVHSPVSGIIKEIKKVTLPSGVVSDAVVIIPDEIQPDCFNEKKEWRNLSSDTLKDIIKEAGIVGQGGATFPTNVKLSVPNGCTIDALIINCVECEPYLTSDYRMILEYMDNFTEGIEICKKIVNPGKVIIAFEANKRQLALDLESEIKSENLDFPVQILKMKYPQGDEKQLIKSCINREIPSGKLPSDVGAVVVNAGTVWAIYKAVVLGMPLIERIVTVSGKEIVKPSNFLVPIGVPIKQLIESAGGMKSNADKIISGGPMMGFSIYDTDIPVIKGTSGIICIKDEKSHVTTACLSCGKCVSACPIGLEPTIMYRLITNGKYAEAMKNNLMDCKECGCCTYSCPAHLELVQVFKLGKKMGRKK